MLLFVQFASFLLHSFNMYSLFSSVFQVPTQDDGSSRRRLKMRNVKNEKALFAQFFFSRVKGKKHVWKIHE